MLMDVFTLVGAAAVGAMVVTAIAWLCVQFKRVYRVARDYHEVAPKPEDVRPWGESNYFTRLQNGLTETKSRVYIAERNANNAIYRIGVHVKDYKHMKTAKAIKRDKERKAVEEGCRNKRDFRGGDGM